MQILLRDPALVDDVIKKITDVYPARDGDRFINHVIPELKKNLTPDNPFLLEVEYCFDLDDNLLRSTFGGRFLDRITSDIQVISYKSLRL